MKRAHRRDTPFLSRTAGWPGDIGMRREEGPPLPVNTNKNGKPAVMADGKYDAYLQSWLFQIDISKVPSHTPSLLAHTYVHIRRLSRVRLFALSYCQTIPRPYPLSSFVMFLASVSFLVPFSFPHFQHFSIYLIYNYFPSLRFFLIYIYHFLSFLSSCILFSLFFSLFDFIFSLRTFSLLIPHLFRFPSFSLTHRRSIRIKSVAWPSRKIDFISFRRSSPLFRAYRVASGPDGQFFCRPWKLDGSVLQNVTWILQWRFTTTATTPFENSKITRLKMRAVSQATPFRRTRPT